MSKKLIIVWIVGIVIFLGIGLFGFLNQGLLLDESEENNKPVIENSTTKTCTISINDVNLVYQFKLDTDVIKKLTITYYNNSGNLDLYNKAASITNHYSEGLTSSISGESNEYKLLTLIDYTTYNDSKISPIENDLKALGINISSSTDYLTYVSFLKSVNTNNAITCD